MLKRVDTFRELERPHFIVRLLSPLGSYPTEGFRTDFEAMVTTSDLCFTVTSVSKDDDSFSEIDNLAPAELPLLGSIMLCADTDQFRLHPYPSPVVFRAHSGRGLEITDEVVEQAKAMLLAKITQHDGPVWPTSLVHRPPAIGGEIPYELEFSADRNPSRHHALGALKAAGPVFLRAVSALIKANMARRHEEFQEAGLLSLWIVMDAAHSIILERLRQAGNPNPSSKDAASYVYQAYGIANEDAAWERFFEYDYENRIRFNHPNNRFGAEARPFGLADDIHELNDNLIDLLFFLLTDIPRDTQTLIKT
jgi:hypothetical protein